MNDFDDLVFQRLCHLKDAGQTIANQTEFADLGISVDEVVYSLRRLQRMRFCYVLPYPQYAERDFQSFSVEIYTEAIHNYLDGGW